MKKIAALLLACMLFVSGCQGKKEEKEASEKSVVVTTTFISDIVDTLSEGKIKKHVLINVGVDPHLFEAKPQDLEKINKADLLLYSGLHLEAKLSNVFDKLSKKEGKQIAAVTKTIDEKELLKLDEDGETVVDPHYWFDVNLYKKSVKVVLDELVKFDPENKAMYEKNYDKYVVELDSLKQYAKSQISLIDKNSRYLITPHDAFQYFSRANEIEVKALQGVSTDSEIATKDVIDLVDFIYNHKVKAIFVESTTPHKNIEAIKEALKAKGFSVALGEELYSDSLSDASHGAETYIKMYKHNVDAMVKALK